ncbi:MAG: hypothetical protein V3T22_00485, partial [Planctomycetota bacterium]
MEIKKEIAFFVLFSAYLGWGAYGLLDSEPTARRSRRSTAGDDVLAYDPRAVPDVSLALPREGRTVAFSRDLFTKPRDTAPLPPLALEPPPLETLDALAPPTAYGPSPRTMGPWLRRPLVITQVPDLFELEAAAPQTELDPAFDLGQAPDSELSAQERLDRIEAYKRLYDWVVENAQLRFGHIRNKDRFDLRRTGEDILFEQVNPADGQPTYPGQEPIRLEPDGPRLQEFGLADSPPNRVELGRRRFGDVLGPGELGPALAFAALCIELRNEAPRALQVAQEVLHMCTAVQGVDVRPWLGLAHCYELGFRFEDAFAVYRQLTTGEFHTEPEPWARLGDLQTRFRMLRKAEASYREGLSRKSTNWHVRWRYGRFLMAEGRGEEALTHLREANRRQPKTIVMRSMRVGIRADLGRALVMVGRPDEARQLFLDASAADPSDDAGLAGLYSVGVLLEDGPLVDLGAGLAQGGPDASFDLLMALGLQGVHQEEWVSARRFLEQARDADPFRAWIALRSLSWLAEITGHPEEALSFIDRAYTANPIDPWILFQRGRLLAAEDDEPGAMQSLRAALTRELDFADALIALADLSRRAADFEAAERYYARALGLDPQRPLVHSLRGFNFFALGDPQRAREEFRQALSAQPTLASAQIGAAWGYYTAGDPAESQVRFARIVDERRAEPEDDVYKVHAQAQALRIAAHEEQEVWTDRFDRVGRVGNGWSYDQGLGVEVRLRGDGQVWMEGTFNGAGRTRLTRELPADRFLSFEATVTVHQGTGDVLVGIFVARERVDRQDVVRSIAAVELQRTHQGKLQATLTKKGAS